MVSSPSILDMLVAVSWADGDTNVLSKIWQLSLMISVTFLSYLSKNWL